MAVNRKKAQQIMQSNGWDVKIRFKGFRPNTGLSESASDVFNQQWTTDKTHFSCMDVDWCHIAVVVD